MGQTRRRQFLVAAGVVFVTPLSRAFAQTPKHARVGFITPGSRPAQAGSQPLSSRLRELGWVEGKNLTLERRYGEGRDERFAELATELVHLNVHVIVLWGNIVAKAVQKATRSIPVVLLNALDPVGAGFAQSLARPGGNVTGVLWADTAFSAKTLQLLKEAVPTMKRVGMLYTPSAGMDGVVKALDVAARQLGVTLYRFPVARPEDVGPALAAAKKNGVEALRVSYDGALISAEAQVREFAGANKLPDFYTYPLPVTRGGFMAYTPNLSDTQARGAALVDKILKGANPAELPFEYPMRTLLTVNLKTAKERGITVPQSILLRADQVIE